MPLCLSTCLSISGAAGMNAAAWSPGDETSLALWLDPSNADTLTLGPSPNFLVEQIDDLSGFDRHMSQSTEAKRPSFQADGINSRGVLKCNGTHVMRGATGPNANNGGPMSCFAVVSSPTGIAIRPVFWFGGGPGAWMLRIGGDDLAQVYRGTNVAVAPVGSAIDGFAIISGHGDNAVSGNHFAGEDGNYGTGVDSSDLGAITTWVLLANNNESVFFDGLLGEVLIFHDDDIELLVNAFTYLSQKWGPS